MKNFLLFIILCMGWASSANALWIQYDVATGAQVATNSQKVSDQALADIGRAQIQYDGSDPFTKMVDVTQNPPVVIPAPPPSPPPASEIDLIFNAMVQSGQIDPSTIDKSTLDRVNASLAVSGASTIKSSGR